MTRNKIKNGGGAGAIRRWRSVAVTALVVGMIKASIAWAVPGDDGLGRVRSFGSKFVTHVTITRVAVASFAVDGVLAVSAGSAKRSEVIA